MASRAKAAGAPVGSAAWVQSERQQAVQFIEQEVDEFGYSVRNDLEWLDEHMSEVVFGRGGMSLADVFKTPGRLRGKTPRTARKLGPVPARQPLADIFAPNAPPTRPSPPKKEKEKGKQQPAALDAKVVRLAVAPDQEEAGASRPMSRSRSPLRVGEPGNTDSGYHGMPEDEMEVENRTEVASSQRQDREDEENDDDDDDDVDRNEGEVVVVVEVEEEEEEEEDLAVVPVKEHQQRPPPMRSNPAGEGGQVSDESFMSAKEEWASRNASREQLRGEDEAEAAPVEDGQVNEPMVEAMLPAPSHQTEMDNADDAEMADDTPHSPSDGTSSPEKPLQRKSSFAFSALPAREPLTAKRSIGMRESQIDAGRHSTLAARATTASAGGFVPHDDGHVEMDLAASAAASKAPQKSTTQTLHERIAMLGKTKEPRASKSVAQTVMAATYPQLPAAEEADVDADAQDEDAVEQAADDDDDWIAPSKPAQQKAATAPAPVSHTPQGTPPRPAMPQKSVSTTDIPSPSRPPLPGGHNKTQSVSNPSLARTAGTIQSTTPSASPAKKHFHEGPLSASKSKLLSAFKSAKNIFASSASASAAAKLEAHNSPSVHVSPKRDFSAESKTAAVFNMPGALYSQPHISRSPSRPISVISVISASPSRKTRSSDESDKKREKELKAQQKAADELEKARAKERQKAARQQEEQRKAGAAPAAKEETERQAAGGRPASADSERGDMGPPPPPPPPPPTSKSLLPAGKLRAPQRLLRTGRNEPAAKPAPALIRVASQSQRLGQTGNAALSKSQHESMAPPPPPKTGLRTASTQAGGRAGPAAPPNARSVRALEAAARKKEADERAAARKLEQKREMDRKRAAKAEEDRRAEEERKAAEQARLQEARAAGQRKAEAEARRKEQLRADQQQQQQQQRVNEEAQRARAAHELAEAIKRERAAAQPAARGDVGGTLRQLAKSTVPEHRPAVQPNPAKPAKRAFQGGEEEEDQEVAAMGRAAPPPQRPGMPRGPPSYQQNDAKRRRTNEEEAVTQQRHSVMAPPKRPSGMRKESTLHKFPHGYTHAPPPAAHHAASSMFKATLTAQHQLQHAGKPMPAHPSQTVQMSSARIPFAENANPPAAPSYPPHPQQQTYHPGHENAGPGGPAASNKFKTPGRPAPAAIGNKSAAKSSPSYVNGDAIQLPEIMTDSEDDEDEDDDEAGNAPGGFRAPSWVASPALRDLLTQQQLVDPETVFGPIGELKMEEVFRNGKNAERLRRFRERGSSARWVETGDAVTSAEKRRDMEMRERVAREGGWRFEPA